MPLTPDTQTLIHEVDALTRSIPENQNRIKKRFVDDYHELVDEIEANTNLSLSRFRISDNDLQSSADRFSEVLGRNGMSSIPMSIRKDWETPEVEADVLRSKGNRLVAFFRVQMNEETAAREQHITISGSGHQTVVGIAGGSLDQAVTYKVVPRDDSALLTGLEQLGVDSDYLKALAEILTSAKDEPTKVQGVRTWLKDFTSDMLSETISTAAANQLPSVVALGLGYLA